MEGRWARTREDKGRFEKQQPFAGQEREAGPGEPGTARNASLVTKPSVCFLSKALGRLRGKVPFKTVPYKLSLSCQHRLQGLLCSSFEKNPL